MSPAAARAAKMFKKKRIKEKGFIAKPSGKKIIY